MICRNSKDGYLVFLFSYDAVPADIRYVKKTKDCEFVNLSNWELAITDGTHISAVSPKQKYTD